MFGITSSASSRLFSFLPYNRANQVSSRRQVVSKRVNNIFEEAVAPDATKNDIVRFDEYVESVKNGTIHFTEQAAISRLLKALEHIAYNPRDPQAIFHLQKIIDMTQPYSVLYIFCYQLLSPSLPLPYHRFPRILQDLRKRLDILMQGIYF